MSVHGKINYIELPSKNLEKTKQFFVTAFSWTFTDYGPEYTAFTDEGVDGGFYLSTTTSLVDNGAALVVFYSRNLEDTQSVVENAGGSINKVIFSFPGGRRFHFIEPGGNEFAVWSDKAVIA